MMTALNLGGAMKRRDFIAALGGAAVGAIRPRPHLLRADRSASADAGIDIFVRQPDGKWSIERFMAFAVDEPGCRKQGTGGRAG